MNHHFFTAPFTMRIYSQNVLLGGLEPPLLASEASALSIKLQEQRNIIY